MSRSKRFLQLCIVLFAIASLLGSASPALAQTKRPEAGPFDPSKMEMQYPPQQGVAIRAGHLFDPD
jgi:hypothetical protein